jgi:DeoR family glycerol-3-phosphate regulon repressor
VSSANQEYEVSQAVTETTAGGLSALRQQQLLERLQRDQSLQVAALAEEFGISQETIRRDLKVLEKNGKLKRVYGGAIATPAAGIRPLVDRERINQAEKAAIAALARDLVKEGDSIFIGEGTTTLALARLLAHHLPCKFMTNMIDIGAALGKGGKHEIFITGGRLYPDHGIMAGHAAISAAQSEIYDIAFVGTSSISLDIGFLDHERVLSEMNKALINRARRLVVLADNSKFGASARFVTYELSAVDTLITDSRPSKAYTAALEDADVEIICP